jgi:hypothetical protein
MFNRIALKCLALILFFSIGFNVAIKAQFGNEWIKPTQKYVKIKVSTEGLYSITYAQMVQAGLTPNTIDPKKIQLFNKGKQVALMVSGNQNTLENSDKITFYGQANDASLDKVLYKTQSDLPNPEVSLFEDANYYFLTYSETENGLRYQNKSISNAGLTPESYVITNSRLNLKSNYYSGLYIFAEITYSEYIAGEGYLGETYGMGQNLNYTLNTPYFATGTNFDSNASFYIAGRSNAQSSNAKGNHHLNVKINNITLADTVFRSYAIIRQQNKTGLGNLSALTPVVFSSVNDLGAKADAQAPAYVDINYPRLLNLTGANSLKFKLNTQQQNAYLKFTNSTLGNAIILNNTDNSVYTETKNTTNSDFTVLAKPTDSYYLCDFNASNATVLEPVTFKNFKANDVKPFLIVTNKNFMAGADAYKTYNEGSRNWQQP